MLLFSLLYCWFYWYGSTAGFIGTELRAQNSKTVDGESSESSLERPLGEDMEPSSAGGFLCFGKNLCLNTPRGDLNMNLSAPT